MGLSTKYLLEPLHYDDSEVVKPSVEFPPVVFPLVTFWARAGMNMFIELIPTDVAQMVTAIASSTTRARRIIIVLYIQIMGIARVNCLRFLICSRYKCNCTAQIEIPESES